jgi:glucokinase
VAITEAEVWRGAAAGYRNALCMVVSTGVGGGLVLDGAVRPGPTGNAGHIGHISVDLDGDPCPCGSRGCVEILASGTAIARYAREHGWQAPDGDTTAAAVAAGAAAGEAVPLAAFDRSARALAAGIAATATLVELEAVVIGGGVAQAGPLLFEPLARHLATYAALPFAQGIQVHRAVLGTDAGLVGAAAAAMRTVTSRPSTS